MSSEMTDIRAEIRLLRDEVQQIRDRHLVIEKRYAGTLESLKILTHQSAESAKRACNAAELAADRHQVEHVHQEYPTENGKRQRANEIIMALERRFNAALYQFDNGFDEVLQSARNAGRDFAADRHKKCDKDEPGNK